MAVRQLTATMLEALALKTLRVLDVTDSLVSPIAVAAALRRAGSALSPVSQRALSASVVDALRPIASDEAQLVELVDSTLQELVAYGDLLEAPSETGLAVRQLYRAAPSFVRFDSDVLLFGLRRLDQPLVPEPLASRVLHDGHRRRIAGVTDEELRTLHDHDLVELTAAQWLKCPRATYPSAVVAEYVAALQQQEPTSFTDGVQIIDGARPVTYYNGRKTTLTPKHSGRFVGRRQQAFGADLWCFLEVEGGVVTRFLDLPQPACHYRGCDEAWRLQAALDAMHGAPQVFRVRSTDAGTQALELFSPVPSWLQRRWDSLGRPLPKYAGCLFAYEFTRSHLDAEIAFAMQNLWMQPRADER